MDWHRGNETTCYSDSGNYTSTLIVPEAIGYIQRMEKQPKPYFLYLPFHLIHGPNQVPKKYEDLYDAAYPTLDEGLSAESQGLCGVCACPSHSNGANATWAECRTVLGMAAALDEAVGEVFDALKAGSSYENSVIVYTSDNGAQGGQGGTSYPLKVRCLDNCTAQGVSANSSWPVINDSSSVNLLVFFRDGRHSCLR